MRRDLPALIALTVLAAVLATLTAVTAVVALTATPADAQAPGPAPVAYRPPVAAPVVEGFVASATPYGPGHRGLAYGTGPATPVRAAAGGVVTFAGSVAGARHVTILHADRVRTTYAFLADIAVGAGEAVEAGDVLGTSAGRFLWTARLGGAYLDPAVLLAASRHATVRLVPDLRPEASDRSTLHPPPRPTPRRPVPAAAARWALEGAG